MADSNQHTEPSAPTHMELIEHRLSTVTDRPHGISWYRAYQLDVKWLLEQYEESRTATQKWYDEAHNKRKENARLLEQYQAAEQAREQLTNALAFYADFEESGHSSWSMATDTLEALYGAIPQPDEPIPALSNPASEPKP